MRFFSFIPKYGRWVLGLLLTIIAIVIVCVVISNNSKLTCNNCNVILVSIDTLAAQHLPCYGYDRNTAPNLCSYGSKNLLFTNSYSQSPITLDSHFSILTSLYPHTHKMTNISGPPLSDKYFTLAQILRENGYSTIYNGILTDLHLPLNKGIERGFSIIKGSSNIATWDESYRLLEENLKENKKTFLFLHTYAVHQPYLTGHKAKHLYTTQKEYANIPLSVDEYGKITPAYLDFVVNNIERLNNNLDGEANKYYIETDLKLAKEIKKTKKFEDKLRIYNKMSLPYKGASMQQWRGSAINLDDPAQIEYLKALYDEKINEMDQKIKKLINLVESSKFSKNTILVITSDHGEEFMEHGKLYHAWNLYTTSTQVPLIIHIPGVKPKTITDFVQGIDIYPTILSLLGLKPKSLTEGIDLSGIIKGDGNGVRNKYLLSEFEGKIGIQMQDWRYYYDVKDKKSVGLYNLAEDKKEQKNLIEGNKAKEDEFLNLVKGLNLPLN